jgi:hypothetical protein
MQTVAHLEAAHGGIDIGIEHLRLAGIEFEIARIDSRSRNAGSAALLTPTRAPLAIAGTSGQPPLATTASYCAIEASVVCAVEGDSVGNVFFGSRTLREELSKPESMLESWFSWISSSSNWSGVCSTAFARRASAVAARPAPRTRMLRRVNRLPIRQM